jgi:beta-phosphoglucomutase
MAQIKAVVFDLDGVLADLVEAHYVALNEALAASGLPIISRADQDSTYNGLPTKTKLKLLGVEDPAVIKRVYDDKQRFTMKVVPQFCKFNPELKRLLRWLQDKGYKLAVASNAIADTIEHALMSMDIEKEFSFWISNQDVSNPKPHPEIYLKACTRLALEPYEVLVVEDSPHGVRAALEAGCRLCQVAGPHEVTLERIQECINEDLGN